MDYRGQHACAVDECAKALAYHILMCRPHWRMVPKPMQRDVTATWRKASRLSGEVLSNPARVEAVKDYLAARQAAVDLVNGKVSRD